MQARITRRRAAPMLALLLPPVALLAAPAAEARLVRGTVVHRNVRAHSFVLADRAGSLIPVHARHSPALGSNLVVSVRRLRNGTYRLQRLRRAAGRRHHRVRLRGIVTYVDRRNATFTLSAEGVSMLVRRGGAHAASVSTALPRVGTKVTVTGMVGTEDVLHATSVHAEGAAEGPIDLEGSVVSIDTSTSTLTISADDEALSGKTITVSVPQSIEITTFAVGEEVELQVTLQPDGSYLLEGSSSDEGVKGAEDEADHQGATTDAADQEDAAEEAASSSGDHEGSTGDHEGATGDHEGSTGDHEGATGDHEGSTSDHEGATGDREGATAGGEQEGTPTSTDGATAGGK